MRNGYGARQRAAPFSEGEYQSQLLRQANAVNTVYVQLVAPEAEPLYRQVLAGWRGSLAQSLRGVAASSSHPSS